MMSDDHDDTSAAELPHQRRVFIVGIPGVGKSTVVAKVLEMLGSKGRQAKVVNFGTVMLEEAKLSAGVKSRDEIRKLPIEKQKALQIHAATKIAETHGEFVIVDTHLFIATKEGFWPGIPVDVLQALRPTNLVLVNAKPEEILERRRGDETRSRDPATKESLEKELLAANAMLY